MSNQLPGQFILGWAPETTWHIEFLCFFHPVTIQVVYQVQFSKMIHEQFTIPWMERVLALQGRCHQLQQPGQRLRTSTALGGCTRGGVSPWGRWADGWRLRVKGPGGKADWTCWAHRFGVCCIFVMFLVHRFGNLLFWFLEVWDHCMSKDTGYRLDPFGNCTWLAGKSHVQEPSQFTNRDFPASHVWRRLSFPPSKRRSREKEIKIHQWICGSI